MAQQVARLVAVLVLLGAAASLATPKGRLPLALRGVAKLFRIRGEECAVPVWKRMLALALVGLSILLALI